MKEAQRTELGGALRLRAAMRSVAAIKAVIKRTDRGWLIELSDGRSCAFGRDLARTDDELLAAAVQWARRHGAASIDVRS
jgi:hypothetical protein